MTFFRITTKPLSPRLAVCKIPFSLCRAIIHAVLLPEKDHFVQRLERVILTNDTLFIF